jgi:hypothetical protein
MVPTPRPTALATLIPNSLASSARALRSLAGSAPGRHSCLRTSPCLVTKYLILGGVHSQRPIVPQPRHLSPMVSRRRGTALIAREDRTELGDSPRQHEDCRLGSKFISCRAGCTPTRPAFSCGSFLKSRKIPGVFLDPDAPLPLIQMASSHTIAAYMCAERSARMSAPTVRAVW